MNYILIIIVSLSLSVQLRISRERVIVYNSYPDMIEIIKTFHGDSLFSVDAIFTSRNSIHTNINDYETFYYGSAKEFYSWLLNLELLFESEAGTMKALPSHDIFVTKSNGVSINFRGKNIPDENFKHLNIYLKDKSCLLDLTHKELQIIKDSFYKWCINNKINIVN